MTAKPKNGFTLVEIMIAAVIVALLTGLVGPKVLGTKESAAKAQMINTLKSLTASQLGYKSVNQRFATDVSDLQAPTSPVRFVEDKDIQSVILIWGANALATSTLESSGYVAEVTHRKSAMVCGIMAGQSAPAGVYYDNKIKCATDGDWQDE